MNIKQTYQRIVEYANLFAKSIRDVYEQDTREVRDVYRDVRDIYERDIRKLDSNQIYTIRKMGDPFFPRPVIGLEAKL